ncbi:hypothetical protein F3Y22_tig00110239pilonHSYRG00037 [Hibiscus syriacus]|uniref:CCHC-type domain-containing protein n=1 Tax=Hibiscus syriacus TaxID=106335 RepID=A0A6A3BAA0_HIBSY|nr:hypothetical protein F3Y22_tig00110239pilonHSYRG00037 [Hibiscus syriacus]
MANKGEGSVGAARDPEGFVTYKAGVDGGGRLGRIAPTSSRNHTIMFGGRDKAMLLLCSLPPFYEHMVTTLTYVKETIKVEEITEALLAHNQRKQNAVESSQADSLYVKGNRDRGLKLENVGSGKRNFISKYRDKKTIHCYKCKEARHMKRDCPKLKKQTDDKCDDSSKSVNVVEDDNSDYSEGDMPSISTTQLMNVWILDSGCSYHITPNREYFLTYRSINSGSVYLGDDRCYNIVGIGDVRIKICKLDFCKYCVLGKQTKVRFKTGKHITEGILDYVHSDVWGPSTTSSLGGSRVSLAGKVADEVWTSHDVTFDHLRIFGCHAYVHVHADERSKLDAKSKECIFLGYKTGVKGFKFWDPVAKKIVISRDVVFDKQPMLQQNKDTTVVDFEQFPVEKPKNSQPTSGSSSMVDLQDYSFARDRENDKWMAAMVEEIESLNRNRTWELVRLLREFDMKNLCAAKKILGMKICKDRDSRKLWLSQRGYVEKMLARFTMSSAKPMGTPLANHFKLSSEQCPKTYKETEDMAKVPYSNVVGCLMYAMVCTRPDLAHVVSQVFKYMSKPGKQHWEAVNWIFRYLKGTVRHGIVFGSQRDNPLVVGYVDLDYTGDLDNRIFTTEYVFTLGGGPICWKSTIQSVVALSTTEVEYMAAADAAKEALWFTGLVKELGVLVYRARTKHIDVRFPKIIELVASGEILFHNVHTDENSADMFTKPGQDIRQGGDLLGMTHKYTGKEDRGWIGVSEANIICHYKVSLVEGVTIMWVRGAGRSPDGTG